MPFYVREKNSGLGDLSRMLVSAPGFIQQGKRYGQQLALDRAQDAASMQKSLADARQTNLETAMLGDQRRYQAGLGEDLGILSAYQTGQSRLLPPPAPGSGGSPLEIDINESIGMNPDLFTSRAVPQTDDASMALANILRGFGGNAEQITGAMMQGGVGSEASRAAHGGQNQLAAVLNAIASGSAVPDLYSTNASGTVQDVYGGGLNESGQLAQANIGAEQALESQRLTDEGTQLMQHAAAAGLQPGTPEYEQFIMDNAVKSGVTVNAGNRGPQVGSVPQGWQLREVQTPEGTTYRMEPVPGGPAELEHQQAVEQSQRQGELTQRYGDVVLEDIDRAEQMIENANIPITGLGSLASPIPQTPAHDLAKLLDTIRANIGFDRLQQMREASPTGGALGQVSELENRLLQATLGSLEQSQSEGQLRENLDRMRRIYQGIIHGVMDEQGNIRPLEPEDVQGVEGQPGQGGGPADYAGQQPAPEAAQPQTQEEYEQLPSGAIFIDPGDGQPYRKP